ncbi:MAG: HAD-IC family P-type ATPase [Candidatus Paceibacterota bacterium]|jgi:Ca2+-transporting ATPase
MTIRNTDTDKLLSHSFWMLPASEVAALLKTNIQEGLSEHEAEKRLAIFGPNSIEESRQVPWFLILLNQFKSPLILILLFAGTATFFIAHYRDAIFIFSTIIVNALLGFYQEHKAEKALSEIKTYLKQRARVIRGGVERDIDAAQVVPGDVMRIAQGDRVSADGRLVFVNDLQIDEAILTGESLPSSKSVNPVSLSAGIGDQHSMAFAGTLVTQGIGTAIVCRTDFSTELGKIAELVGESHREETPLQKAIELFSLRAGILLSTLTLAVFGAGITLGYSYMDMFLTSVAIAVSAVPEGLPVAMTVILAIGVQRMARRKGVIRKLIAAEALGSTTVILTDKTGTLTQANMALSKLLPALGETEESLLDLALLNTDVLVENPDDPPSEWRMSGRVLETALTRSAAERGGRTAAEIKLGTPILSFLPFNAVNKFSASLIHTHGKYLLTFFGAPETFIMHSTLTPIEQEEALKMIEELAQSGELVMGIATKEIEKPDDFTFSNDLKFSHLSFRGLLTLRDPIRPNVKEAIRDVELAGIRTIIMTGDHRGTAEAIAREVGMEIGEHSILDAVELRGMADETLKERLRHVRVIARVSPLDKMRIVQMFQSMGEIVAMTGDGVNDAPSIKQADIGIAMGSGTEVSRSVADLVLLDDNFETIVAAVEEGRQIMHNIRKVLVYLLSSVADELFLIGGALATGLVLPLNALQILWVNFFSDSFPAVAFAFEKNADGRMTRRPQSIRDGLFDPVMRFLVIFIGLSTSVLLFFLYWFLLRTGFPEDVVRTFIFASFGSYSLFLAFSLRSLEKSIFSFSPFSNHYLVGGVGIGIALLGIAIYVPFFQSILDTVALSLPWVLGVVSVGVINIIAVELGKWFFNRRPAV